MDKGAILKLTELITDDKMNSPDGKRYLRLKILALTFCGEYEKAYKVTQRGMKIFPNDWEILTADGLLANKLNIESDSLDLAHSVLGKTNVKNMTENELIAKHYLDLVLNKANDTEIGGEEIKPVILYYNNLDRSDLLKTPPLGFLLLEPVIIAPEKKVDDEGWQWFE
jgi:hypothetical protein